MKTTYRWIGVLALSVLTVSTVAHAGLKTSSPVKITRNSDGSLNLSGSLGSARSSAGSVSYIECDHSVITGSTGSTSIATVSASDGVKTASCLTSDPTAVDALSRISGDSYISIFVDTSGTCLRILVTAASWAPPKS